MQGWGGRGKLGFPTRMGGRGKLGFPTKKMIFISLII